MEERVRFGAARPAVRKELVAELRSEADRLGRDPLVEHAADEIESLERRIGRILDVLVDVKDWSRATSLQPPWLVRLITAAEDEC